MTDVVGIRATPRAEAIAALRALADRAETDKTFVFIGYWKCDDECKYMWTGLDTDEALGLSARLTHNLNKWWDESLEDS